MAGSSTIGYVKRLVGSRRTLFVFGTCGLAGVLVDLDHFASLILWRYIFPWITEGRLIHTPLFLISCLAICCVGARIPGLYAKLVLVGIVSVTIVVLIWSSYTVWSW
jgi:hypothetical protein